jgi:glycerophosphoryl diester phosphodiesterase
MRASPRLLTAPLLALVAVAAALAGTNADAFDLQGHRGARGLAPENTLAAFERALQLGVTTLELDIGITADGVPVILHDFALNPAVARDPSGSWVQSRPLVRSLTLAELQRYDVGRLDPASRYGQQFATQQPRDGERIPTLAALFQRVRALGAGAVRFNIETKVDPRQPDATLEPAAFVDRLLQVIRDEGMLERVTLQSFDWRTLQHARRLAPGIPTACLTAQGSSPDNLRDEAWTACMKLVDHESVAALVKAAGCSTWSPNFNNLDEAGAKAAQGLGLSVIPWTVDRAEDMRRLIAWGVDGLITDYPDRLREVLAEKGLGLPAPLQR